MPIKIYKSLTQKYSCFTNIISKFIRSVTSRDTRPGPLKSDYYMTDNCTTYYETLLHLISTFNVSDDLYDMGIAKNIIKVNESRDLTSVFTSWHTYSAF